MNGVGSDGSTAHAAYELRFRSLFDEGRALAFPCDAHGEVRLAALSPKARENFRRARCGTGRDYAMPSVEPLAAR